MPAYTQKFASDPPGPYVSVRLSSATATRDVEGLLDTGADQTLIPIVTARALGLRQIGDVRVGGVSGDWREEPLYVVDVTFGELTFSALPVIGSPWPIVLIGRDILNELVVTFDGPGLTFTFARSG